MSATEGTGTGKAARVATVTSDADGVLVIAPVRRNWWHVGFLGLGLLVWAFGELVVLSQLVILCFSASKTGVTADNAAPAVWFLFWTIAGYFAISAWLWHAWGREELLIGQKSVTLRVAVGKWIRSKEFDLARVHNISAGQENSGVVFRYGSWTYRFGRGLDATTRKAVVDAMRGQKKAPSKPPVSNAALASET